MVLIRSTLGHNRSSLRSVARDIETPTLRLRTIEGNIRAGKVILIIDIQQGGDRERAGPRLHGRPHHRDHEILARPRSRERPFIVVPGIRERALPGSRELPIRLGDMQYEPPRPARLSWSVPVQVPVKGSGSLSLEQPRRITARTNTPHRHGLHCMEALS